jgi:glycerol-3-phosphate acyltransferase PlsY
MVFNVLFVLAAYLLGSLSSAIILCRLMGLPDPRTEGSGNPGATNVLRLGGRKVAALTLLGDTLKGLLPVVAAQALGAAPTVVGLVGLAAFLGHLYPVFFRFQGGKGVATAFGVLIGAAWPVALAVLATWLAMAFLFRISSLSALTAATLAPLYTVFLAPPLLPMILVMCVLLIWRHRSNIRKLVAGEEKRIGR